MIKKLTHVTVLVRNFEEALDFYTNKLGFVKVRDVGQGAMRFLSVAPQGQGTEIVLLEPNPARGGEAGAKLMTSLIGKGPMMIFKVDNCKKTCDELKQKGVTIIQQPGKSPFGIQAVIADLYGNQMVLVEYPR
jgi:catechol 2,3-dioxygenase-like lactoylglutathione lyase family enzyme